MTASSITIQTRTAELMAFIQALPAAKQESARQLLEQRLAKSGPESEGAEKLRVALEKVTTTSIIKQPSPARYIVTKKDLRGDIEYFSVETVQKMVDEQVRQGNPADPTVFQKAYNASYDEDGFTWHDTQEGYEYWDNLTSKEKVG